MIGLVDVDQAPGVRIVGNVLGIAWSAVRIGQPMRMVWVDVTAEVTLPTVAVRRSLAAPGRGESGPGDVSS